MFGGSRCVFDQFFIRTSLAFVRTPFVLVLISIANLTVVNTGNGRNGGECTRRTRLTRLFVPNAWLVRVATDGTRKGNGRDRASGGTVVSRVSAWATIQVGIHPPPHWTGLDTSISLFVAKVPLCWVAIDLATSAQVGIGNCPVQVGTHCRGLASLVEAGQTRTGGTIHCSTLTDIGIAALGAGRSMGTEPVGGTIQSGLSRAQHCLTNARG